MLVIILFGYLLFVATTLVFPKLVHPNFNAFRSYKLVSIRLFFIDFNRLRRFSGKLAILLCSLNWFIFLNFNFLSGNIKTDSVVVRTDEIIDSLPKVMDTKRTMTIILDELEAFTKASEHSIMGKLNKKKLFVAGYRPEEDQEKLLNSITNYFFFERKIGLNYLMSTIASLSSHLNLVAFMKPTIYYETTDVIAIRRTLDEHKKRFIHQR